MQTRLIALPPASLVRCCLPPNNSFKPSPLRGLDFALSCNAMLGRVRGPA